MQFRLKGLFHNEEVFRDVYQVSCLFADKRGLVAFVVKSRCLELCTCNFTSEKLLQRCLNVN